MNGTITLIPGVLYERHAPAVFRYLARRAGPPAAEDLLSEVFIAALSASPRVMAHGSGSALPWLYGIGLNVQRRHFRLRRARKRVLNALEKPGPGGPGTHVTTLYTKEQAS